MGLTLKSVVYAAHSQAESSGWWDEENWNIAEKLALIHSEVSEALEEIRKPGDEDHSILHFDESGKPVGFVSELADVIIRIADLCGKMNIDLESAVTEKMLYNAMRTRRHGGKKF